jgi:hypothetical protein
MEAVEGRIMTRIAWRFNLGRAMAAIVLLAIFLAAFRAESFAGIFAGCIACATYARSSGAIDRHRRAGMRVTWWQAARVIGSSLLVSLVILGLADLTFVVVNGVWISLFSRRMHHLDPAFTITSLILGIIAALGVATLLRVLLWPCEIKKLGPASGTFVTGPPSGDSTHQSQEDCVPEIAYHVGDPADSR